MLSSVDKYIIGSVTDKMKEEVVEQIRKRVEYTCHCLIGIVRAIEKEYGPEGKEIARKGFLDHFAKLSKENGGKVKRDIVQSYCSAEKDWAGTHEWERRVDSRDKVAYRFTKCMWAEVFRKLKAPDIGKWLCDSDEPCARAFNPKIKFKRTKTLMQGDSICDHVFYR